MCNTFITALFTIARLQNQVIHQQMDKENVVYTIQLFSHLKKDRIMLSVRKLMQTRDHHIK